MPIQRCVKDGKLGWKWGKHGACYPTKAQANQQRKAIKAAQSQIQRGKR